MNYIINKPSSFLFTQPSPYSSVADEAIFGMECEIIGEEQDFFEVKMFYGYRGYIKKNDIKEDKMYDGLISAGYADILPTPEFKLKPVINLPKGARVNIGDRVGNFVEIFLDGKVFYTFYKNVTQYNITSPKELRKSLKKSALEYLGTSYRWGGMTPSGIDCSGLTFMAYYLNGYIIYRDADQSFFLTFKEIELGDIKTGDLLFFPGHIGMYIGDDSFIHSAGAFGGVNISSLNKDSPLFSEYYKNNIQGVFQHSVLYKTGY